METKKAEAAFRPNTLQLGILVRDLEKAKKDYSALLNMGPWSETIEVTDVNVKASVAMLGPVEVELFEIEMDESIMVELLGDDEASLNHIGFYIDDPDAQVARFEELGVEFSLKEAGGKGQGGVIAYIMETKSRVGINLELLHRLP